MKIGKIVAGVLILAGIAALYLALRKADPPAHEPEAAAVEAGRAEAPEVADPATLIRFHSPTLGPQVAPVTIVEFFDPACEACRAFYPKVKELLEQHPQDVRLVLRYAAFHKDSDKAIRLLEAAKAQGKYWEVLEALLATQSMWADHGRPNIDLAYQAARQAGLDLDKALAEAATPRMDALLAQEKEDLIANKIAMTPTFFVNGERLGETGVSQLNAAVAGKLAQARK